eukprot:gnl/Hemi2/4683_TR1617_c0_g1_i1.p1 gnl/Hemi2/4683_TR1617_c0_g1~~gnl/Hemi2/4683_TR1617_c0_g1_i1.p1  ORF type:complete len:342 (-),score=111.93 gnl/Hemi2/4683_TR1617_c0_g1_i1:106-1131(-)
METVLDWASFVFGLAAPAALTFHACTDGYAGADRPFWLGYWQAYSFVLAAEQLVGGCGGASLVYLAVKLAIIAVLWNEKARAYAYNTMVLRVASFVLHVILFGQVLPMGYFLQEVWHRLLRTHSRDPFNTVTHRYITHVVERYFQVRVTQLDGSQELLPSSTRALYLFPHRSWGDFFIHQYLMRGAAASLARLMVGAVFPVFMLCRFLDDGVWFFNSGKVQRDDFANWLDHMFSINTKNGLIVYPEGHRNLKSEPLPLRRGMVHYAFRKNMPVQIVMTHNTEAVLSEKEFRWQCGCTIPYRVCAPLWPKDFVDKDAFFEAVEQLFKAQFASVHALCSDGSR